MKKISKELYQQVVKNGFTPKHNVRRTSHGRYYYIEDSDYRVFENLAKPLEVSNA